MPVHLSNWYFGWSLILAGFFTGALLGLFFHRDDFMGGYTSFRRRIVRLGHIACVALGMLNILYSLSPWPASGAWNDKFASPLFIIGGISMPLICFLTGWRMPFKNLFFIPVASLAGAVVFTLLS